MTKAYVIKSIQTGPKQRHKASTPTNPVVIDLSAKEFDRLAAMGIVRKPDEKELRMAALTAVEDAEIVSEDDDQNGADPELTAAREEYEELFQAKAGNMKLETLLNKIAEKKKADQDLGV